jgi:hypothetical protein
MKKRTQQRRKVISTKVNSNALKIETLKMTDGSKVYDLIIGNVRIACTDYTQAITIYNDLAGLLDKALDVQIG